ncbi:MAG: transporter substrate-binding domain-containing protein [Immundisolibacteraceae bacterium]|nr:transporter substrate-binding domain-containing protein [Immundisolibacteraceae bacterium]
MRLALLTLIWIGSSNLAWSMGKPLSICLEQQNPPYSTQQGGLDNLIALALADGLGAPLTIHWFETEEGDEGNPTLQVNALLSDGICELAGGFPMAKNSFADPGEQRYSLMLSSGERRSVSLQPLAPSLPYHARSYTLVWANDKPHPPINSLDDLENIRVLAEENTIADLILMAHGGGKLRASIDHIKPNGDALLKALAKQQSDAAWIALHRFEDWQQAHPDSLFSRSGFQHEFAINLGFAALKSNHQLLERVNNLLTEMADDEQMEPLFEQRGLTYFPPQQPDLMPPISTRFLASH